MGKKIIRVFPRKTSATPDDDLVRIGVGPGLFDEADEIHISVSFTWDIPLSEKLAYQWERVAPVKVGGPAYGDTGGDFVPGMYVKKGYVIHHRGCPNKCWFCIERNTPVKLLKVHEGWNDISSNVLACPKEHREKVAEALLSGKKIYKKRIEFTGGLEAKILDWEKTEWLKSLNPEQMFFAYDTPDDLNPLFYAGEILKEAGFKQFTDGGRSMRCYVLCGYPKDTRESAYKRIIETIHAGFMPMAMLYRDKHGKRDNEWMKWQRQFARPAIISSILKDLRLTTKPRHA